MRDGRTDGRTYRPRVTYKVAHTRLKSLVNLVWILLIREIPNKDKGEESYDDPADYQGSKTELCESVADRVFVSV